MNSLLVLLFLMPAVVQGFYSINFAVQDDKAVNVIGAGQTFTEPPSAEHVADLYARLSGLPPILREDKVKLPSLDVLDGKPKQPIILEVHGGVLPSHVTSVMRASAFTNDKRAPSLDSVTSVLKGHGISVVSSSIHAKEDTPVTLSEWIKKQDAPVLILHHETPASHHYIQRALSTQRALASNSSSNSSSSNSTVPALTEFQISQYQICLWTGVLMVAIIVSAILMMINMEVIPDNILYAKFISGRTHKSD